MSRKDRTEGERRPPFISNSGLFHRRGKKNAPVNALGYILRALTAGVARARTLVSEPVLELEALDLIRLKSQPGHQNAAPARTTTWCDHEGLPTPDRGPPPPVAVSSKPIRPDYWDPEAFHSLRSESGRPSRTDLPTSHNEDAHHGLQTVLHTRCSYPIVPNTIYFPQRRRLKLARPSVSQETWKRRSQGASTAVSEGEITSCGDYQS